MPGIFLGLGSNLGDRRALLQQALRALEDRGVTLEAVSSIYETSPVGFEEQPDFLNMVARVSTALSPRQLLEVAKQIELGLGRRSGPRWGPRTIDIDVLLYFDLVIEDADLSVPHPELTKRQFVLRPLLEIAPTAKLPDGETLARFLDEQDQGVKVFHG